MKTLPAATIDAEVQMLSSEEQLEQFLSFIETQLEFATDFELSEAYLKLLFKYHADLIIGNDRLLQSVRQTKDFQDTKTLTLQNLFHNSLCLVSYLGKIQ
jgi:hypothetical protein